MLFYERIARDKSSVPMDVACTYATQDSYVDKTSQASNNSRTDGEDDDLGKFKIELSPDLAEVRFISVLQTQQNFDGMTDNKAVAKLSHFNYFRIYLLIGSSV